MVDGALVLVLRAPLPALGKSLLQVCLYQMPGNACDINYLTNKLSISSFSLYDE